MGNDTGIASEKGVNPAQDDTITILPNSYPVGDTELPSSGEQATGQM